MEIIIIMIVVFPLVNHLFVEMDLSGLVKNNVMMLMEIKTMDVLIVILLDVEMVLYSKEFNSVMMQTVLTQIAV
jgi:hypothetical protein